jgi:protein-disulfide isomerase
MNFRTALMTMAALCVTAVAMAQGPAYNIPKGSKLAIVVYEDLECPACAADDPQIVDASKVYSIPLVRHDYPLPMHPWSMQAHVYAVYFDSKSPALGEEFRRWVFAHQREIYLGNLRQKVDAFAASKGQRVPANPDPTGAFAAKIKKDKALGDSIGLTHTPTVYIVAATPSGMIHEEVKDISSLFVTIDRLKKQAGGKAPAKPAHR